MAKGKGYKPYPKTRLARLLTHFKTAVALAEAAEVSVSAVHSWNRGGNINSSSRAKLNALHADVQKGIAIVTTNRRTAAVIQAATEADQPPRKPRAKPKPPANGTLKLKVAANGTLNLVQRVARLELLVEGIANALGVELE